MILNFFTSLPSLKYNCMTIVIFLGFLASQGYLIYLNNDTDFTLEKSMK
jgi:hypothetical protein